MAEAPFDATEWRFVTTESDLRERLQRGYVGGDSSDHWSASTDGLLETVVLHRGPAIGSRASAVVNPVSEIGQPVTLSWKSELFDNIPREKFLISEDRAEVHALLPLATDMFRIGYSSEERIDVVKNFLSTDADRGFIPLMTANWHVDSALAHVSREALSLFEPAEPEPWKVNQKVWAETLREDRLQSASELMLACSRSAEQLAMASAVLADSPIEESDEIHRELAELRWSSTHVGQGLLSIVTNYLLHLEYRTYQSQLTQVEKSDLLLHCTTTVGKNHQLFGLLDELLHLVRSDESVSDLLERSTDPVFQGLIIFLNNNASPGAVVQLEPTNFGDIDLRATSICAFFTGLRYRRQMIPIGLAFEPLRAVDILTFTEKVNGFPWPTRTTTRTFSLNEESAVIQGKKYVIPVDMDVLTFAPRTISLLCRGKDVFVSVTDVEYIAVHSRRELTSVKKSQKLTPRDESVTEFLRNLRVFKYSEKNYWVQLFTDGSIKDLVESQPSIEMKFSGEVIVSSGKYPKRFDKPTLIFSESDVRLPEVSKARGRKRGGDEPDPAVVRAMFARRRMTLDPAPKKSNEGAK